MAIFFMVLLAVFAATIVTVAIVFKASLPLVTGQVRAMLDADFSDVEPQAGDPIGGGGGGGPG
jgi:hypothetical protein